MRRLILPSVTCILAACTTDAKPPIELALAGADGKADAAPATEGAPLQLGASVTGTLTVGGQVRHTLTLAAPARVTLEVTQEGTARGLDTTLHLLGPVTANGAVPTLARAADDDGGHGSLSRLEAIPLDAGVWHVVVGTFDGRGRGAYRLEARCDGGTCGPVPCADDTVARVLACAAGVEEGAPVGVDGPPYDPYATRDWDVHLACARAEAAPEAATGCAIESWGRSREGACAFGARYADLASGRVEAVVVVGRSVVSDAGGLDALSASQLLEAVRSTAYDDVADAAEALATVDEGRANRTVLWDASNGAAYVSWEVGAGDNSFGAIFPIDSAEPVATIVDGDFDGCEVSWGPMRRWCTDDAQCGAGLACLGRAPSDGLGLCAAAGGDELAEAAGRQCAPWLEDFGCPAGEGLVCGSADRDRAGVCVEAHHRVMAGPVADVEVGAGAETVVPLVARGVGATTAGVRLELLLVHPRLGDVQVTLSGPDGRSASVFDGAAAGPELERGELVVEGFGDRALTGGPAVGEWRLRILDRGQGEGGRVFRAGLTVTARP